MESTVPSVFVNSSREGIARVKAGNYAYMMESSMLEYYMERDCQLQRIGGLLDSKVPFRHTVLMIPKFHFQESMPPWYASILKTSIQPIITVLALVQR